MQSILIALGLAAMAQTVPAANIARPLPPTIEEVITAEFGEHSRVMTEIARCESTLRQHNEVGGPIENPVTHDIGLFQINPIHFNEFAKLGISIYSVEGNIQAARVLFDQSHLGPWRSSLKCWGHALED